jgi:hypothetical protein
MTVDGAVCRWSGELFLIEGHLLDLRAIGIEPVRWTSMPRRHSVGFYYIVIVDLYDHGVLY